MYHGVHTYTNPVGMVTMRCVAILRDCLQTALNRIKDGSL